LISIYDFMGRWADPEQRGSQGVTSSSSGACKGNASVSGAGNQQPKVAERVSESDASKVENRDSLGPVDRVRELLASLSASERERFSGLPNLLEMPSHVPVVDLPSKPGGGGGRIFEEEPAKMTMAIATGRQV
jgi:hypothetical protein